MSKLTDTFFRAVIYKAVWKTPFFILIPIVIVVAIVSWGTVADYIGVDKCVTIGSLEIGC